MSTTNRRPATPGFYDVPKGNQITNCPKCNRKVYDTGGRVLHVLSVKNVEGLIVAREHHRCCPGIKSGCPDPELPSQVNEWDMTWLNPHGITEVQNCRRCGEEVARVGRGGRLLDLARQEQWGDDTRGNPNMMAPPHYQFCKEAKA